MHDDDGGPRPLAVRPGDVHRKVMAVARRDALEARRRHRLGRQRGMRAADQRQLAGLAIEQAEHGRLAIRPRRHQHAGRAAAGGGIDDVDQARQRGVHARLQRRHLGIEPDGAVGVRLVVHAQHAVPGPVLHQRAAEVEALHAHHGAGRHLSRGQVHHVERVGAAVRVRGLRDVQASVGAEAFDAEAVAGLRGIEVRDAPPLSRNVRRHIQRGLAGVLGDDAAHLAGTVDQPRLRVGGQRRIDQLAHRVRAGVEPHRHPEAALAVPVHRVAGAVAAAGPVSDDVARAVAQRAPHVMEGRVLQLDQEVAGAVDGPGAAAREVAHGFELVADVEDQPLVVDPLHAEHVGVGRARRDVHLQRVGIGDVDHRQLAATLVVAHQHGERVARRREQRPRHVRRRHEQLRRQAGRGCVRGGRCREAGFQACDQPCGDDGRQRFHPAIQERPPSLRIAIDGRRSSWVESAYSAASRRLLDRASGRQPSRDFPASSAGSLCVPDAGPSTLRTRAHRCRIGGCRQQPDWSAQ